METRTLEDTQVEGAKCVTCFMGEADEEVKEVEVALVGAVEPECNREEAPSGICDTR